ncbi:DUF1036 domain-containing protein [Maricaulis maris]|jgi:uncharacterized membrane protein|uniref:DUF1036 domain-containing protein n=1 Tax=Maricaulis maris TaxID=74318 RepID=UPI0029244C5C|nr:membrane protein [Maricaulis maris]
MLRYLLAGLLALPVLLLTSAPRADAAELCNETSYIVEAAAAWAVEGGVAIEGWTRLRPGNCVTIADDVDLDSDQPIFYYAKSSIAYLGGVREWRGTVPLCVDESDFEVVANTRCSSLGMASRDFFIREGEDRERTVLVEPVDFGRRATTAGIQRLLQSAGYPSSTVDGLEGNTTRRAVSTFLRDAGLSSRPDNDALIDALEARALARNAASGLTVCNDADGDIAVAIGHQVGTIWQSRGWWRIHAGECARVLATRFETPTAFFYAERINTAGRRGLIDGSESFCVAPARFVAEGRRDCAERGYAAANFRRITEPSDGGSRISLGEGDFRRP